jgi:ferredoxin
MNHQQQTNLDALNAAYTALASLEVKPTGCVEYSSSGRLLVIANSEAQDLFGHLGHAPEITWLKTDTIRVAPIDRVTVIPVAGRQLTVSGYLGAFELVVHNPDGTRLTLQADTVLDLGDPPLLGLSLLPPGYLAARPGNETYSQLAAQLAELVGVFEKPRYFRYDPDICAHGRSGLTGCTRCLDACPAEAISSIGDAVEVNPYLCQGGGICASVCPSGAMRYAYPGPADTLAQVRTLLSEYHTAGGRDALVMFAADQANREAQPNVLVVQVEEVGSVGPEIMLAALAYGARQVVLLDGGEIPEVVRVALAEQIDMVEAILRGMNYPANTVRLVTEIEPDAAVAGVMPEIPAAAFAALDEKRRVFTLAADHLYDNATATNDTIPLPTGSPYGHVEIKTAQCTLCMACTSVCPVGALDAGTDSPQLIFREANCVQCGICVQACPETALSLRPRFVCDTELRRKAVTLHEEAPFLCITCGTPFTTRSIIDLMLQKLEGHPMFQDDKARQRLMMCDDCRVVDAIQDTKLMDQV